LGIWSGTCTFFLSFEVPRRALPVHTFDRLGDIRNVLLGLVDLGLACGKGAPLGPWTPL
jgi:hypothetical protein